MKDALVEGKERKWGIARQKKWRSPHSEKAPVTPPFALVLHSQKVLMVRVTRLELAHLSVPEPKSGVSAIPPHPHLKDSKPTII